MACVALHCVMVGEGRPSTSLQVVDGGFDRIYRHSYMRGHRKTWMFGTDPRIKSGDEQDERGTAEARNSVGIEPLAHMQDDAIGERLAPGLGIADAPVE